ncbi:MAG TPA: hypothetical protein VK590_15265 [Saprospiraceae bacterium]|nr:hypothetical protein [Saprospiraceae bacterium]
MDSNKLDIIISNDDDTYIVASLKNGSQEALSILYDKYAACLLGIIMRTIINTEEAEEVLRKSFIEVWNSIAEYNEKYFSLFQWMKMLTLKQIKLYQNKNENNTDLAIQSVIIPVSSIDSITRLRSKFNLNDGLAYDDCDNALLELIYITGNKLEDLAVYLNISIDKMKHIIIAAIKRMTNSEIL